MLWQHAGDLWPLSSLPKKSGQPMLGFEYRTLSSSAQPLATRPPSPLGQTVLPNSLQTSMILLMYPILLLILMATTSTLQILQKLYSKDKIFQKVYTWVGAFYKVKPYIPPTYQCQNCWRFGRPAKYCRSTARCPLCTSPGHTRTNCPSTIRICANCTQGCPVYKFELEVAVLHFKQL